MRFFSKITYTICFFFSLCWIAIVIWASNRGFDMSDEGLYLCAFSKNVNISLHYFHLIHKNIFSFIPISIQNLRLERLFIMLFSALVFSIGAYRYLKYELYCIYVSFSEIFIFVLCGSFLSYAFGPQTPSYNSYSTAILLLIIGVFFIALTTFYSEWKKVLLYFIIGILMTLLFLAKFPNTILAFILISTFFYFHHKINKTESLPKYFLLFEFIIIVSYSLSFLFFFKTPLKVIAFHQQVLNDSIANSHYTADLLIPFYFNSFVLQKDILFSFKYIVVFVSIASVIYALIKNNFKLFFVFFVIHLFVLIYLKIYHGGEINKTHQTSYYLILIILFTIISFKKSLKGINNKKTILFVLFLFITPYLGAFGTNNLLHIQIVFYMSFWFLLIYWQAKRVIQTNFFHLIFLLVFFLSFSQSITAFVFHPYRLKTNLLGQNQEVMIFKNDQILIDKDQKKMILEIDSVLKKEGVDNKSFLFVSSEMLGLCYALNYSFATVSTPWVNNADYKENVLRLSAFVDSHGHPSIVFIEPESNRFPFEFVSLLKNIGYDLNSMYSKFFVAKGEIRIYVPNKYFILNK